MQALTLAGLLTTPEAWAAVHMQELQCLSDVGRQMRAVAVVDAAGIGALVVWGRSGRHRERLLALFRWTSKRQA